MKINVVTLTIGVVILVTIIALTAVLIPQQTNPAFAASVDFVNAAGQGDDDAAMQHIGDELTGYVADNCPGGSVSACIDAYTPPEWGAFVNAVFRRAQPDGPDAWDVVVLGTYEEDQGFSGVCIYNRVERSGDAWQVVRWSGWISCDRNDAGLSALAQPDAANSAP